MHTQGYRIFNVVTYFVWQFSSYHS